MWPFRFNRSLTSLTALDKHFAVRRADRSNAETRIGKSGF